MNKARTYASIALAVLVLGGLLVALPQTDVSDAEPVDIDGYLGTAAEYCAQGWEAGLQLEPTDDAAFEAMREFASSLPEQFIDDNELLKTLSSGDISSVDDFYTEILGEDGVNVNAVSTGHVYLYAACVPSNDGYEITVKVNASFYINMRGDFTDNPSQGLYTDIRLNAEVSAGAVVNLTRDMVPVSGDFGLVYTYTDREETNHVNNGSGPVPSEVRVSDYGVTDTLSGSVEVSGLTAEDIDAIVNGGESPTADVFIVFNNNYAVDPDDPSREYDSGSEFRGTVELPTGLMESTGVDGSQVDSIIGSIGGGSLIPGYSTIQPILEMWGIFIPQEDYNKVAGALRAIFSDLRTDGYFDFGYTIGDSRYNSDLVSEMEAATVGITIDGADPVVSIADDYSLTYDRSGDEDAYTISFSSDTAQAPTHIKGYPTTTGETPTPGSGYDYEDGVFGYYINGSNSVWGYVLDEAFGTSVTIPTSVTIDNKPYNVTGVTDQGIYLDDLDASGFEGVVEVFDARIENLRLDADTEINIYGANIDNLYYSNEEGYDCNIYWVNYSLNGLGNLYFDDNLVNLNGRITLEGYTGLGSTYTYDGVDYYLTVRGGDYIGYATETYSNVDLYSNFDYDGHTVTADWSRLWEIENTEFIDVFSIPDNFSVTSQSLTAIQFDNNAEIDIPSGTFYECYNLEEITFNGPLKTIESRAFNNCLGIKYLNFNNSVDEIGSRNFTALGGVEQIIFQGDVGTIASNAFSGCNNLTKIWFYNNVDTISYNAFSECGKLETIQVDKNLGSIDTQNETHRLVEIIVGGDLGEICNYAFSDKQVYTTSADGEELVPTLFSISVTGKIGTIGEGAFQGSSLSSITAGKGIGTIESWAFAYINYDEDDEKELEVEIGDGAGVEGIEGWAFYESDFSPRTIIHATTYAHPQAFEGCTGTFSVGFENVSNGQSGEAYGSDGLKYEYSLYIENKKISADIGSIGWTDDQTLIGSYSIPTSLRIDGMDVTVTAVGYSFGGWNDVDRTMEKLSIGGNVQRIGVFFNYIFEAIKVGSVEFEDESPFTSVTSTTGNVITIMTKGDEPTMCAILNKMNIEGGTYKVPDNITVLDLSLFRNLDVETLDTNKVVKIVGDFGNFDGIEHIIIGPDLESYDPWNSPVNLKYITVDAGNTTYASYNGVLYEKNEDGTLTLFFVPPNLVEEVTHLDGGTVSSFTAPNTVDGKRVTAIGYAAFIYSEIDTITIEADVSILEGAVFNYSVTTTINLPANIEIFGYGMFDFCNPDLIVSTADGATNPVYTTDGAIYFINNQATDDYGELTSFKSMVAYVGGDNHIFVEEGTQSVWFGANKTFNDYTKDQYQDRYVFLPDSVKDSDLSGLGVRYGKTYVLLSTDTYQDSNYSSLNTVFRTYTASDVYKFEFAYDETNDELDFTVTAEDFAHITYVRMGDNRLFSNGSGVQTATFSMAVKTLFDGTPEANYVLPDVIEVECNVEPHTVTFVTGITGQDDEVDVTHNQRVDVPDDPVREGFSFNGWFADRSCTVPFDFEMPITKNTTIYAGWTQMYLISVGTEGVAFYVNGEEVTSEQSIYLLPGYYAVWVNYLEGYEGGGDMYANGMQIYGDLNVENVNIVLTADAQKLPTHYRITLVNDPSKGTCITTYIDVPIGDPVNLPTPVALEGYRFVGWTSGYQLYSSGFYPHSDMTLEAAYVALVNSAEVSFSYSPSDGKPQGSTNTINVEVGTIISLPGMDPKHGLTFLGWTANGDVIEGDTYTVTGDVRLTAIFKENPSTSGNRVVLNLHIERSEGQFSGNTTINLTRGDTYTLPTIEGKRGFQMVAWSVDGISVAPGTEITVDENTTATAVFQRTSVQPDTHRVQFQVSGQGSFEGPVEMIVFDEQTIELPEATAGSGYRFVGWFANGVQIQDDVYTVTSDVTITAQFTRISSGGGGTTTPGGDNPGGDTPGDDDGGSTITDEDGNTIHEVVRPDGSSTTTTTRPDGSSTVVDVKPTENGKETVEEVFDSEGNLTGSTSIVESTQTTESGNTVQSTTTTTMDGNGNTTSEVTNITATSQDGSVKTDVTVSDGTAQSQTTVTVSSDGSGTVSVGADKIQEALNQIDEVTSEHETVEKTITIQSDAYTPDKAEATLDADALTAVVDSGASVAISGDVGTITIGSDVAGNLSQSGNPVSISVATGNRATMTDAQQQIVGDSPVFELNASAGDENIHELGGDVTVTVPYTLQPGDDPNRITVFYVTDDGSLEAKLTTYDPVTHTVTFVTDHFSYYMIGMSAEEPADDGGDNTLLYVGIVVVIVVVVAAVAVVARNRL